MMGSARAESSGLCRLNFDKLRRMARWGTVSSSRVLLSRWDRDTCPDWRPKYAESPWVQEPRVMLAALHKYRMHMEVNAT